MIPFLETAVNPFGSWRDRVKEGAYKSPSGTRIRFHFEDVSRSFEARGTVFEFPGIDNAYVQRTGISSRRYPLTCYFTGPTCDLEAAAFEAALSEPGIGTLQHPLYGEIPVTPFGEIERRDDLVRAANQSVVTVTFWTTTGVPYPSSSINAESEILRALAGFDVAAAQSFSNSMDLGNESFRASAKATFLDFLNKTEAALESASADIADARQDFQTIVDTVNRSIDVLVGTPLALAAQAVALVQAPGRALSSIAERLAGYQTMANEIIASALATPSQTLVSATALATRSAKIANDFHIADLFLMSAVSGQVLATTEHTFATKREALEAAEATELLFTQVAGWRDTGFTALEAVPSKTQSIDTGDSYQQLQYAVSQTIGRLVEISFSLFPERFVVLDRDRTIIDVAAELYGSVSNDTLDYLINTNSLTGSEILELPKGKRIAYYAQG